MSDEQKSVTFSANARVKTNRAHTRSTIPSITVTVCRANQTDSERMMLQTFRFQLKHAQELLIGAISFRGSFFSRASDFRLLFS
jgi:hypothetical protein